jgi:hypothetical protein
MQPATITEMSDERAAEVVAAIERVRDEATAAGAKSVEGILLPIAGKPRSAVNEA